MYRRKRGTERLHVELLDKREMVLWNQWGTDVLNNIAKKQWITYGKNCGKSVSYQTIHTQFARKTLVVASIRNRTVAILSGQNDYRPIPAVRHNARCMNYAQMRDAYSSNFIQDLNLKYHCTSLANKKCPFIGLSLGQTLKKVRVFRSF